MITGIEWYDLYQEVFNFLPANETMAVTNTTTVMELKGIKMADKRGVKWPETVKVIPTVL